MTPSRCTSLLFRLAMLALLGGTVPGCFLSEATASKPTVISVHVRDDRGSPIDKIHVDVSQSNTFKTSSETSSDGTVEFVVSHVGVYSVVIAPRDGYQVGADLPAKSVWVVGNVNVALDFTLQRTSSNP